MPETATTQAVRLVELVAWMSQRDSNKPVSYRAAARRLGVTEEIIRTDLSTLVGLTDAYKPWLASLNVAIPTLITGYFGMNVPYPGFSQTAATWDAVSPWGWT